MIKIISGIGVYFASGFFCSAQNGEATPDSTTTIEARPKDGFFSALIHMVDTLDCWCSGTVYVQFIVQKDGSLNDVTIIKGLNDCYDDAVKKCFIGSSPWLPAMQNGVPVVTRYTYPFTMNTVISVPCNQEEAE